MKIKTIFLAATVALVSCQVQSNKASKSIEKIEVNAAEKETRDLPTVNIKKNDKLSSPALIEVNSEGVWLASEGSLGYVELLDEKGNELARGFLTTNEEWMTEKPVQFSTMLNFDAKNNETGTLVIHNDPGAGDGDEAGEKISFTIPVTF